MDVFEFRKQLYLISNRLSSDEVKTLVFICGRIIPRRQQEKIRTGFELFCALSEKKSISLGDVQFLTQILDSVGKSYLTQPLLERGGGRGVQEVREWRTPPVEAQRIDYDTVRLEERFHVMLIDVADELSDRNIRDIALFFFDPDRNLGLQEVERLRSARDLFEILKDNRVIGFTDLQKLRFVLEVLGRHDACRKIEAYMKQTKDFIKTPSADAQGLNPRESMVHVPPGERYSSGSAANSMNSQVSGLSSVGTASLISGGMSFASGGSRPLTSFHMDFPGAQPSSTHAPETMKGDNGKSAVIYSGGLKSIAVDQCHGEPMSMDSTSTKRSRPATGELLRLVSVKDDQIQHQQEEIQHLRQEIGQEERVFRKAQIQSLSSELERKIKEVNSAQKEVSNLREQLLQAEDVPLYPMECNPHGLAIVIVNEKFNANPYMPGLVLEAREGANEDKLLFTQTFQHLGYRVETYRDVAAVQMHQVMEGVSKTDHSKFDSFVCCISTHGDEHMMYGSDSVGVKRTEFDRPLKHCPTLSGKPKMFFIQACRATPHSQVDTSSPSQQIAPKASLLPLDADMFIANATTPRCLSYRSRKNGSWFVVALHRTFTTKAHHQMLFPMMYEVNTVVCDARGAVPNTATDQPGETTEVMQCGECTTSFRKGVRFFKPVN